MHVVAPQFPDVAQLDLTGSIQVLSRLPWAQIALAWRNVESVATDSGFSILPATAFDWGLQTDILVVLGRQGAFALMDDDAAMDFVRRRAAGARYVTSVSTGSFVLGATGLLQGRRVTTHWASHPRLEVQGAVPVQKRCGA